MYISRREVYFSWCSGENYVGISCVRSFDCCCKKKKAAFSSPGIGTTGMGAPSAAYLGLSARIGYRPMLLGRQMMTAMTSIMMHTSMKTVIPQITAQSGFKFCGCFYNRENIRVRVATAILLKSTVDIRC